MHLSMLSILDVVQDLLVLCELSSPVAVNALPTPFDRIRAYFFGHNELGMLVLGTRVLRRMGPL